VADPQKDEAVIEISPLEKSEPPTTDDVIPDPVENQRPSEVEEFNKHIENLVALYADKILQEFAQRLLDLETLAKQPDGAVRFYAAPDALTGNPNPAITRSDRSREPESVPTYVPGGRQADSSGVPWYSG
jgi:hypothetical protein